MQFKNLKRTAVLCMSLLILSGCGSAADAPAVTDEGTAETSAAEESASAEGSTSAETDEAEGSATDYFDLEFHRGGRDARPENTLYSYQYALENGATTIECDMQMTADGEIVLSHNGTLNPDITVDEDGNRVESGIRIDSLTLEELQKYNVGSMDPDSEYYELHGQTQVQVDTCIPSLRELFDLVRESGNDEVLFNIEIKSCPDPAMGEEQTDEGDMEAILDEFYSLVCEYDLKDRVCLQSFDWAMLVKMKEIDPSIKIAGLYSEEPDWGSADATTLWLDREEASPWLGGLNIHDYNDDPVELAHALEIDVVSPYYTEITSEQVAKAHEYGMTVIPWTINSVDALKQVLQLGVDGAITDKPWELREYLLSEGYALPDTQTVDLPYHLDTDHVEVQTEGSSNGMDAAY